MNSYSPEFEGHRSGRESRKRSSGPSDLQGWRQAAPAPTQGQGFPLEMGVWSPRTVLDPVLFLASSLMEPPPSTGMCLPREQRVFQESPVCQGLSPGRPGGQWAPAPPLRDQPEAGAWGWRCSDTRSRGSGRDDKSARPQGSDPAFLGRILVSVCPGTQRPSRESGGRAWQWENGPIPGS